MATETMSMPASTTTTTTSSKRKHSLISKAPKPPLPSPIIATTSIETYLAQIKSSPKGSPFEKSIWSKICQIPPGSFSTYGLLASHLHSSPRAVGNALRKNPFAPGVPCHRILATGNTLGGFKGKVARRDGSEAEGNLTLIEKRTLLKKEGVRFDDKGRALGTPFMGFK
ncbi:6-O-methylguanine DNA methyltransferase [Podospora australis]|uniref:Methylated-DNA--protein-cysteine methyltransferase n=1 Tax=Podospora australis TaxID=1536484 RepID=A0AAN6WNW0_9PEZI|nr:6-O-methylguanine DNA methyltransferase [Podospora australis]